MGVSEYQYFLAEKAPLAYIGVDKILITVAETTPFLRQAAGLWHDDDRNEFVDYFAANPGAGHVIPDTGGLRKIRWSRPGTGKRGGVRIIYFYHDDAMPLYLLLMCAKAQREEWTRDEKRRAQALTEQIKQAHRRH
ncbi:addiction module toxin RelE [Rhodopila sp.]|uniref:addiction module toxin RelE n=1 Tax=Rhodopila sp. TaxID=2480087 RepID=UPI003D0DD719